MPRILVIEDDELTRNWLVSLLTRAGYDVATAANGTEGVTMFEANPADLVITDIVMPEKDGIETIIELKQAHSGIKVIAISGDERRPIGTSHNYLHSAELLGADLTLQKPISNQTMIESVRSLLS